MAELVTRRGIDLALERSATEGRIPPQAVDVEAQILGAMLVDNEAIARVLDTLDEDTFHADYHRKIFQGIVALFERSQPVDTITLADELRRRGHLETVGGEQYLVELTMKVVSGANVEYHARIILEQALKRAVISTGTTMAQRGYNPEIDAFDLIDESERSIFTISERRLRRHFTSMNMAVHGTLEILEHIHGKGDGVTGVPTGFRDLDLLTGGWQETDLIIIAGRPSCGKTALALSLAKNCALHHEKPVGVGFFSLEMSTNQLVIRLLAAEAKVDAHALRTGRLPEDGWKRLSIVAGRMANAPIYIDDSAMMSILEFRAKARRMKAEKKIGLVVVDYLQLMQGSRNAENREKEIASISRGLKALAKELHIPVIALSQLSRAVEARTDRRPILSDLRESGAIEQDADVVAFVHRPEMFLNRESEEYRAAQGGAEIIVAKQRNGPTDDVKLAFVHRYARFENLAPAHQESLALVPADPRYGRDE